MGLSWGSRADHVLGPFASDALVSDSAGADEAEDDAANGSDDDDVAVQWDDSAVDMDVDVDELFLEAPEDDYDSPVSHAPLHRSLSAPLSYRSFAHHQGFDPVVGDILVSHERETA